jgi:hypothetical protein
MIGLRFDLQTVSADEAGRSSQGIFGKGDGLIKIEDIGNSFIG